MAEGTDETKRQEAYQQSLDAMTDAVNLCAYIRKIEDRAKRIGELYSRHIELKIKFTNKLPITLTQSEKKICENLKSYLHTSFGINCSNKQILEKLIETLELLAENEVEAFQEEMKQEKIGRKSNAKKGTFKKGEK